MSALPDCERAFIEDDKLLDALSPRSERGQHKAQVFESALGFNLSIHPGTESKRMKKAKRYDTVILTAARGRISDFCIERGRNRRQVLIVGEGGRFGVREEVVPAAIAPEGFQAHESFVSVDGPELAGALETALVLSAGGFDGS